MRGGLPGLSCVALAEQGRLRPTSLCRAVYELCHAEPSRPRYSCIFKAPHNKSIMLRQEFPQGVSQIRRSAILQSSSLTFQFDFIYS